MYGIKDLKEKIIVTCDIVECPVKGCTYLVPRQKITFKKQKEFQCPIHKIYISPSTFEYEHEEDNLLWHDEFDKEFFQNIKAVKTESRIAKDNSEDAITWNVFRYLEKENLLNEFLFTFSLKIEESELILWSYSQNENSAWTWLNKARLEFGETISRGSEPDIIIITDKTLYFIEAKLNAVNRTQPKKIVERKKYETRGNNHFKKVFSSSYQTIAIDDKRYELMRFWLLGTWIAEQLNLDFELISLLRQANEKHLVNDFSQHINKIKGVCHSRISWEDIYKFIESTPESNLKDNMEQYFRNKTIGYNNGKLKKAFNV